MPSLGWLTSLHEVTIKPQRQGIRLYDPRKRLHREPGSRNRDTRTFECLYSANGSANERNGDYHRHSQCGSTEKRNIDEKYLVGDIITIGFAQSRPIGPIYCETKAAGCCLGGFHAPKGHLRLGPLNMRQFKGLYDKTSKLAIQRFPMLGRGENEESIVTDTAMTVKDTPD